MSKAKDRSYAFRALKEDGLWQVLVFEAGTRGVARTHTIKILGNAHKKADAVCNCKAKWYNHRKQCRHEKAFDVYMLKSMKEKGYTLSQ